MFARQRSSKTAFVTRSVKLETHPTRQLNAHQESLKHKEAMKRLSDYKPNVNIYRQLLTQEQGDISKNKAAVKKIFQCIHFRIQKKMAFTENTEDLVRLVASLGVKDLQEHLDKEVKSKYLSTSSINEMLICMSDLFEQDLLSSIREKEFSLLADESSDQAHRSQMSVMARFGTENSVATNFLGFIKLNKGDATYITSALEGFLVAKGIDIHKKRFTGFDGCNTMSGAQTGVQRRMSHLSSFSTYVNCRNHRLALCLTHLIKRFPVLQDVDSAHLSLWKLFDYSPRKFKVFRHIQTVYGVKPFAITKACTTRWLSHLQAAARFVSR
ncbi:uncharacterized protein LOC128236285 [Mya arenaria]|nr:uncharacterized protein LOC128236285 [Mya arenaria]